MRKTLCIILTLLMLTTVLVACFNGDVPSSSDTNSEPNDSVEPDKIIIYANGGEPPVLEPVMSNYAKTSILVYNLFCGLTRIGEDGTSELTYAESYTVSDDGLVYTFKIHEDAKFSDGSELNAHHFADAFIYELDPNTGSPGGNLKMFVKGAKEFNQGDGSADEVGIIATDDRTVEITLKSPTPYFLDLCATYIPLKVEEIKANPNWAKSPETYIGNGAFRVKEINPQASFILEKNPFYYDVENNKIDQVNFMFIDDEAIELQAYKDGTINVSDSLNAEAIATFKDSSEYYSSPKIGTKYLTCHTGNISDEKVRKALAYAIDRRVIIEDILGLTYRPATGIVPYGIHWGDKQYRDVAGELLKSDVARAKELLVEAGYPNGDGLPVLRFITQNNAQDVDTAQAIQAMWKENLGIECEITTYESSVYWDVFDTDDWDVGRDGWTGDYDDPQTIMFLWEAYREGPDLDARWYDTENAIRYDDLMSKTYAELDKETRFNTFVEAEKVLLEDMPIIPLFFYDDPILMKPEVTGVLKSYIGHVFFQYADVID